MTTKEFETVSIVGAGTMGAQIALLCAVHGYSVWLFSRTEQTLQWAAQSHAQTLENRFQNPRLQELEKHEILRRIHSTTHMPEAVEQADLVIENAPDVLEVKRDLFAQLDKLCPPHTILTTESSSFPVSTLEDVVGRRAQVLNLHFVSPVWDGGIAEWMGGTLTSQESINRVRRFVRSLRLYPSPGLLLPRLLSPLLREARRLVEEGVASPQDVDRAWMIASNMQFGPFGIMDLMGLDVILNAVMNRYSRTGDPADAPPKVLVDKVERGQLGVKTGKGFYDYPNPSFQYPGWLRNDEG